MKSHTYTFKKTKQRLLLATALFLTNARPLFAMDNNTAKNSQTAQENNTQKEQPRRNTIKRYAPALSLLVISAAITADQFFFGGKYIITPADRWLLPKLTILLSPLTNLMPNPGLEIELTGDPNSASWKNFQKKIAQLIFKNKEKIQSVTFKV